MHRGCHCLLVVENSHEEGVLVKFEPGTPLIEQLCDFECSLLTLQRCPSRLGLSSECSTDNETYMLDRLPYGLAEKLQEYLVWSLNALLLLVVVLTCVCSLCTGPDSIRYRAVVMGSVSTNDQLDDLKVGCHSISFSD